MSKILLVLFFNVIFSENYVGYLRTAEASFCMDTCSQYYIETETGAYIEKVVNLDGVEVEWVKMRAPDGFLLELLQYRSHPQSPKISLANANDLGCSHVAFTVDEIEKACELICENGGKITNSPAISPNGKVKVAYCHDPEGVLMELVQEL